jgi:EmrB/QacA subfamily drug resistance transporter
LLALVCVAQFVDVLDVNAVVVALPAIGRSFHLPAGELQWVVTAYVLAFAGCLLPAGRLADLFGHRRLFMTGLLIFTIASLACGFAQATPMLIAARAAQGLGAAVTAPAALAIITTSFDAGQRRNAALGVWTAVAAGGGAAGLVVGGLVTEALGWEWIFFVNVPVGVAALALSPLVLPAGRSDQASRGLDLTGAATVTGGLVLLVFAFSHAQRAGVGSPVVLATLGGALLLLVVFVLVERWTRSPLLPLELFRNRGLVGSLAVAAALTATTSSAAVLTTLYLQNVLGYAPSTAGLAALPLSLAVIAGSAGGPRLIRRLGARATMSVGLSGVAAAAGLLATRITVGGGIGYVLAAGALAGSGLGAASVAATSTGASSVRADQRGLVSGLLTTAAQIGTALGIAALVWLAGARTDSLRPRHPPAEALVSGYRGAFVAAAVLAAAAALAARMVISTGGRSTREASETEAGHAPRHERIRGGQSHGKRHAGEDIDHIVLAQIHEGDGQ